MPKLEAYSLQRWLVLAVIVIWNSIAIGVGLYWLIELTSWSVAFLTALLGLLNIPLMFWFRRT